MSALLNGSLLFVCSHSNCEQVYENAMKAYENNHKFQGFETQTQNQNGPAPWHLPKEKVVIVGFVGELPEWLESNPGNSNILVSRWPPTVVGNDVLLWGLESFRPTCIKVEKSNLLTMEQAA